MQSGIGEPQFEEGLGRKLQEFRVPYPDESLIDATVDSLRQYVPSKRRGALNHYGNLKRLIKDTAISMNFMRCSYWIITFLIYAAGYFASTMSFGNPYKLLFILAPLPAIFGLLEVFRGREEGVVELELSCRITPQEIVVSRILVTCVYNALLNLSLSLLLYSQMPLIGLWKITLLWLAPMILTGSVTLWLCSRIRSVYSVLCSVSCWAAASVLLVSQERYFEYLLNLNVWFFLVLICAGTGLLVKEILGIKKRYYF